MQLRKLEMKDAPFMLEWMHDRNVTEYLRTDFAAKTSMDVEEYIRHSWQDEVNMHMAITTDLDEYMGTVSLKYIENGCAEFAITVRSGAMGKGYSWFGMKSIIIMAFDVYGIEEVYWCVSRNNSRAVRFYDKHCFCETTSILQTALDRYKNISNLKWYSVKKTSQMIDLIRG